MPRLLYDGRRARWILLIYPPRLTPRSATMRPPAVIASSHRHLRFLQDSGTPYAGCVIRSYADSRSGLSRGSSARQVSVRQRRARLHNKAKARSRRPRLSRLRPPRVDSHTTHPLCRKCLGARDSPTFLRRRATASDHPDQLPFNPYPLRAAQHPFQALFLGGVTRASISLRLPLGGSVGLQLFCDLIEHWERRGAKGLANMDPTKLDRKRLRELVDKYGYADIGAELDRRDGWPMKEEDSLTGGVPLDDYHFCRISQKQDWVDLFATPYYFGCEADDRMNAVAFGKMMPLGARINALFSSDIGHFDVVDMRDPLPEAYELVEDGHITESDFSDFVFGNAVRLWGTQNPRFFEGTRVAKEAAALLKASTPARAAA